MGYNMGPQRSSKKAALEKILDILWDRDCETFQPFVRARVCVCVCVCVCVFYSILLLELHSLKFFITCSPRRRKMCIVPLLLYWQACYTISTWFLFLCEED